MICKEVTICANHNKIHSVLNMEDHSYIIVPYQKQNVLCIGEYTSPPKIDLTEAQICPMCSKPLFVTDNFSVCSNIGCHTVHYPQRIANTIILQLEHLGITATEALSNYLKNYVIVNRSLDIVDIAMNCKLLPFAEIADLNTILQDATSKMFLDLIGLYDVDADAVDRIGIAYPSARELITAIVNGSFYSSPLYQQLNRFGIALHLSIDTNRNFVTKCSMFCR